MLSEEGSKNFAACFKSHERGRPNRTALLYHPNVLKRINKESSEAHQLAHRLDTAVKNGLWTGIEGVINDAIVALSDTTPDFMQATSPSGLKKQQREFFVVFGGVRSLVSIFRLPHIAADGRNIKIEMMGRRSNCWNEIVVILRDLVISMPSVVDRYMDSGFIAVLITFLTHRTLFDNVMNLLEEILAVREETFALSAVPKLYALLDSFSSRQLAHFCRLLSLVVFEPEDRVILDGPQTPRSIEVLRLRRKRMQKGNNTVVERNQNLILEMPSFISKMVQILRVINFAPSLAEMLNNNVISHIPVSNDILVYNSTTSGLSDWEHFTNLSTIVTAYSNSKPAEGVDNISPELLRAFSLVRSEENDNSRQHEFASLINVMSIAQSMGIARLTALGEALLSMQPRLNGNGNGNLVDLTNTNGGTVISASSNPALTRARKARNELQFHAMLLTPHQIELIFVLCTLLAGRRKLAVQKKLFDAGLPPVLVKMFDRMSWDAPAFNGINTMEHIHGPTCECNPESAVRVQYLRLVHNFFDRDLMGNINKFSMLSQTEQAFVTSSFEDTVNYGFLSNSGGNALTGGSVTTLAVSNDEGLLTKILRVLMTENKKDSSYRFWLSACAENFLRGCGRMVQMLVLRTGCLQYTLQFIINSSLTTAGTKGSNVLQTAFDLLGEMIKGNPMAMEMLESQLSDEDFRHFIHIVTSNLIDSNVFLRALFLNMEIINRSEQIVPYFSSVYNDSGKKVDEARLVTLSEQRGGKVILEAFKSYRYLDNTLNGEECLPMNPASNFLTDSWVLFRPAIVSMTAAKVTANPTEYFKEQQAKSSHSPSRAKAGLASSVAGAIRQVTTHFLRFGESGSPSRNSMSDNNDSFRMNSIAQQLDRTSLFGNFDESSFHTPPEAGCYPRSPGVVGSTTDHIGRESVSPEAPLKRAAVAISKSPIAVPQSGQESAGPTDLFRWSMFLLHEKVSMVVKLMSVVTLRTVSHENICCVNTVLLILLLDNSRGVLAQTLSKVRKLADEANRYAQSLAVRQQSSTKPTSVADFGPLCGICCGDDEAERAVPTVQGQEELGSTAVFCNFREVLWYWQEYYLRRGRDRLSVEFSCHIPFKYWHEVVGKPSVCLFNRSCADGVCRFAMCGRWKANITSDESRRFAQQPLFVANSFNRVSC